MDEALEAIFDDDFVCPESEEEGEDVYAYAGEPTLPRGHVEVICSSVTDD